MHVSEDGSVVGSVDRSKLDELQSSAESDEAKAQVEQLRAEAAAAEEEQAKLQESRTPEAEAAEPETAESESIQSESRVSMALSKEELVNQAEAAGLGDREELEQRTKQQLVDDLRAGEG